MGKASVLMSGNAGTAETLAAQNMAFVQLMLDAGFVQTEDTGQITLETAANGTNNTHFGYAIFRFNDALQATHPVYFKVEFGTYPISGSSRQGEFLTVGKGSDGAGNIIGILAQRTGFRVGSDYQEVLRQIAVSGNGYAALIGSVNDARPIVSSTAHARRFFIIERSRAVDGSTTGDGLLVVTASTSGVNSSTSSGTSNGNSFLAINYETGAYVGSSAICVTGYSINGTTLGPTTSLAAGSIGPVLPWDLIAPGVAPWRSCIAVSIPAGDMPAGVFEARLCSQTSTFFPVPPSVSHSRWGVAIGEANGSSSWFGLGIRWED